MHGCIWGRHLKGARYTDWDWVSESRLEDEGDGVPQDQVTGKIGVVWDLF